MARIAISGHRGLSEETVVLIDRATREALAEYIPDVSGLSYLADGADQIFARAVLDVDGALGAAEVPDLVQDALRPIRRPHRERAGCQMQRLDIVPGTGP